MAAKIEMTEEERRARRAAQSRESRARKAERGGTPAQPKTREAGAVVTGVADMLRAAQTDLEAYNPIPGAKRHAVEYYPEDNMLLLQLDDVPEVDDRRVRREFSNWAASKPWRQALKLSVADVNDPKKKLPGLQFYITTPLGE